jgi:hypothetical protein
LAESDVGNPLAATQFVVQTYFAQDWGNLAVKVGMSVNDNCESVEVADIVSNGNKRAAGQLKNVLHKSLRREFVIELFVVNHNSSLPTCARYCY